MERPLGRGLDSLIARTVGETLGAPSEIPLDAIRPNPGQPRKVMDETALEGLATSIRNHGVLQPVVVRRLEGGSYELIAGERRFRASRLAGRTAIPAVVIDAQGIRSLELALIENIQRENLGALEEAAAYEQLITHTGLTHQELATRVGKSRAAISNALRLLELPEDVKTLVASGTLSAGQARAILGASSDEEARELAQAAASGRWSVRQVEQEVRTRKARRSPKSSTKTPPKTAYYEEELRLLYGTKVTIEDRGGRGSLRFAFYTEKDRDRLLHALLLARPSEA